MPPKTDGGGSLIEPSSLYDTASADAEEFGLGGVFRNVFALLVTAVGFVMTRGIDALGQTFILPLLALAQGGANFVRALFTDPAAALSGAWAFMLESVTTGDWAFFGPFTPIIVFAVILGVLILYLRFADRYDIDLPTTGDIPLVGLDDSSALEEE